MMTSQFDSTVKRIGKECLAMRMRMLNRALTQFYDDALRPLELKLGQFSILLIAAEWETVLPRELCETLHIDASTMSRTLDRLEAAGWIEHFSSRDARAQPFRLTKAGADILERAFPLWQQAQDQAAELLGEMGVALLRETAKRLGRQDQPSSNRKQAKP